MSAAGDAHRLPHRDREGLLPFARDRRTRRAPPRRAARPRPSGRAALGAGLRRRGAAPPPRRRACPSSRRSAATTSPTTAPRCAACWCRFAALRDPAARPRRRGGAALPVHHGGPHRAGHDRRGSRTASRPRSACDDAWPIATEPFTQWVIEDDFALGRPAWDRAGATFVADVAPFELAKLRMLNGSHSTLAYLGYLAGHETVADTMAAPGFAALVGALMLDEAPRPCRRCRASTLAPMRTSLVARFRNPALRHRTWQIAMDGTQKLPQRLLGTVRDRLAAGALLRPAGARRRRLDALRHRPGRAGHGHRPARPAGRRPPPPHGGAHGSRADRPGAVGHRRRLRCATCRPTRASPMPSRRPCRVSDDARAPPPRWRASEAGA